MLAYLAGVALVAVAVTACDGGGFGVTSKADREVVEITVRWVPADGIDAACKAAGADDGAQFAACAASGKTRCTILAVQPRSFDDAAGLRTLGHEAWHCFGARHD